MIMNILLFLLFNIIVLCFTNECSNYNDIVLKTSALNKILNNFNDKSIINITIDDIIKASIEIDETDPEESFRLLPEWLIDKIKNLWNSLAFATETSQTSRAVISFLFYRCATLFFLFFARCLIWLIPYCLENLSGLFSDPKDFAVSTKNKINEIISEYSSFDKVGKLFKTAAWDVSQSFITMAVSAVTSALLFSETEQLTKGVTSKDISEKVQLEEFLFGTMERRDSQRQHMHETNERKYRMEQKLFLDMMQIGWNILEKRKDDGKIHLFMPTEEFFAADDLFRDVPDLRNDLFEAAQRSTADNQALPEFICYIKNLRRNNELMMRVSNRCSQAIRASQWPLYAKNHRISSLETGDPYVDTDKVDEVCMVITCETEGNLTFKGNKGKIETIPPPERKVIRVWLMFESQLKLMREASSWSSPDLIQCKVLSWRLRLRNLHLWCQEYEEYQRASEENKKKLVYMTSKLIVPLTGDKPLAPDQSIYDEDMLNHLDICGYCKDKILEGSPRATPRNKKTTSVASVSEVPPTLSLPPSSTPAKRQSKRVGAKAKSHIN